MPIDSRLPLGIDYGDSDPLGNFQKGFGLRQEIEQAPLKQKQLETKVQDDQIIAANNKLSAISNLLSGVRDQQSYSMAKQQLASLGIINPSDIPDQYDPAYVEMHKNTILNAKNDLDRQYKLAQIAEMQAGGSTGVFANRLRDEPSLRDAYFNKVNAGKGLVINPESNSVEGMPGYNQAVAGTAGAETGAKKTAEMDVARQVNKTKAESALKGFEQQSNLVINNIDNALNTINAFSTGYGSLLSSLPNTDARKLNNYLNTIKSNVGFDKLQNMRENSPTGGALGQVSDMENKLLQAVNGALDPAQTDQLRENLNVIKQLYPQVLEEKKRAFQQDYGNIQPLGNNPQRSKAEKAAEVPANLQAESDALAEEDAIDNKPQLTKSQALEILRKRGHKL